MDELLRAGWNYLWDCPGNKLAEAKEGFLRLLEDRQEAHDLQVRISLEWRQRSHKAESELARWPEAVAKVRVHYIGDQPVNAALDEITRLATERREVQGGY